MPITSHEQSASEIRRVAGILDEAVQARDTDTVMSCFAEDGEVEIFGRTLQGKEAIRRSLEWMLLQFDRIVFEPRVIIIEGGVFFEEFLWRPSAGEREVTIKAAEVLAYENFQVKSLRLYLDRLDLAGILGRTWLDRSLLGRLERETVRGLG